MAKIVISADFSDPNGPILAGPTEAKLLATTLRVSDASSNPLAALKLLGKTFRRAVVLDHYFDAKAGGFAIRRRNFKRAG